MPYDVFISHSSKDKPLADRICQYLEARGVVCWIAPRDISPGDDWSEAIVEGIAHSTAAVLLLSDHANQSRQVRREVQRAFERDLHVVPLRLEEVTLQPALEYYLSSIHWLDALSGVEETHLEQLHQRLQPVLQTRPAADPSPAPATPPAPAPPKHNLPLPATSFVGRETALADIQALLPSARLITLVGPGGNGKTRLSLQIGLESLEAFPDGVWMVELAPLSEPDLVAQTLAEVVGVRENPGEKLLQTLGTALAAKKTLIILDNCEHLLSACAHLAEALLRSCPHVRILASSREGLNIPGEHVYPLPALTLPDPGIRPRPEKLLGYEAVRLFVDRAQAVKPDFVVTPENAPSVASVCRRLDGIPLAIELAAARLRSLSVGEINERLDRRFRLLTGGSRTALPRQQTLRALIDWSYDLLTDTEKTLLQRLSVFVGGWTLETAEEVCSDETLEDWEVLDLLSSLVDKSLAIAETDGNATRYRMLETMRAYGIDKLQESGEEEAVRARHADTFARFAARAEPELHGAAPETWLARLDDDRANLGAALEALSGERAVQLCRHLDEYWHRRGLWSEACERLDDTLARVDTPALQAELLGVRSWFTYLRGDSVQARALAERGLTLAREHQDREAESVALNTLAFVAWRDGDPDAAREGFEASLAVLRETGDAGRQAGRLSNLGLLAAETGDVARAQACLEEARELYTRSGDLPGMGACLCNLADLALRQNDPATARDCARESLEIFERRHDLPGMVYSHANLAEAALRQNEPVEADRHAAEALARCDSEEMRALMPLLLELRVRAFGAQGMAQAADRWLARADAVRDNLQMPRTAEETEAIAEATANLEPLPEEVRARHRAIANAHPSAPWIGEENEDE